MFSFVVRENNVRKLVHRLSRLEIMARSVHVAIELGLPELLSTKSNNRFDINVIHRKLVETSKISSTDINPFARLVKFLACYDIVDVSISDTGFGHNRRCTTEVSATPLTYAMGEPSVKKLILGLNESEWRQQADLLSYFDTPDNASRLQLGDSIVCLSVDAKSAVLTISNESANGLLVDLANIHLLSRAIYTVAEFNLMDLISSGVHTIVGLAAKLNKSEDSLTALFKLLCRFHFIAINNDGILELTKLSTALMDGDNLVSIKAAANMANSNWWNAIGNISHCIKTGGVPYIAANKISVFDYLEAHADDRIKFDRGLANSDADQDVEVSQSLELAGYASIVDIGGGNGGLAANLALKYPAAEVTLFEQPGTIEHLTKKLQAEQPNSQSDSKNVVGLAKCKLQPGNFLDASTKTGIPLGKEVYTIKGVLHDFTDPDVVRILRNLREAMGSNSRLVIIERYVADDNKPHPNKVGDMQMMAFFASKERSLSDYERLAETAGLRLNTQKINSCGDYNMVTAMRIAPNHTPTVLESMHVNAEHVAASGVVSTLVSTLNLNMNSH